MPAGEFDELDQEVQAANDELREIVEEWKTEFETRDPKGSGDYKYQERLSGFIEKMLEKYQLSVEVKRTVENAREFDGIRRKVMAGPDRATFFIKEFESDKREKDYPVVFIPPQRTGFVIVEPLDQLFLNPNEIISMNFVKPVNGQG